MTLYEILGISEEGPTQKGIKKAYFKMSKKTHPDKEGGSEEAFKEVAEAYRILSDPSLREMYDNGCGVEELKTEADNLMNKVFSVFEEAMSSHGFVPDHIDLFKVMRELCNEKEQRMERAIEGVEKEILNLKAIQDRLKNADIFKGYLDNAKEDKKAKISRIEIEKVYIGRILTFIANCEYEVEEDEDFNIPMSQGAGIRRWGRL